MRNLKNKLLSLFKRNHNKRALDIIPDHLRARLIDEGYRQGAKKQREIDLAIIDKAIDTCKDIDCWSEAARRARSDIARQLSI